MVVLEVGAWTKQSDSNIFTRVGPCTRDMNDAIKSERPLTQPLPSRGMRDLDSLTAFLVLSSISAPSMTSIRAVRSMPVGPAVTFSDTRASDELREARATTAAIKAASADAQKAPVIGTRAAAAVMGQGVFSEEAAGVVDGPRREEEGEKQEQSRSIGLSLGCRRCLSCEMLYDLVSCADI